MNFIFICPNLNKVFESADFSVSDNQVNALAAARKDGSIGDAAQIGEVIRGPDEKILVI